MVELLGEGTVDYLLRATHPTGLPPEILVSKSELPMRMNLSRLGVESLELPESLQGEGDATVILPGP